MARRGADLRERFLGCLLGCAVGDALGAPYEGLWTHSIPDEVALLAGFGEFEGYPPGQYTDDTQLSLATVESVLAVGGVNPPDIARSIARLWKRQAVIGPGGACTAAATAFLETGDWTTCGAAVGQAGNGTAMRTAVLGLFFLDDRDALPSLAGDVSRITHHDPRSVAGGVAVAKAAHLLTVEQMDDPQDFCTAITGTVEPFGAEFGKLIRRLPAWLEQEPATTHQEIAGAGQRQPEFDIPIITPFVVPTVLAAFWSLLRFPHSWSSAVAHAIRLGGDVDTLGAIVGALAGAKLGAKAIPRHLVEAVVDSEYIQGLAARYHALVAGKNR